MRIAAVQLRPSPGDIEANLLRHLSFMELAKSQGARLVCFPELSLTGYDARRAADWATTPEDARFGPLQEAATRLSLSVAVGVPLRGSSGIQVGMLIFQPLEPRIVYAKRILHSDELPWFVPGKSQAMLEIDDQVVVPAICYESLQEDHARQAAALGADIYLASVAKSAHGIARAHEHYPAMAQRYGFSVLMANCTGPCDEFIAVGQSAAWDSQGTKQDGLEDDREGMVLLDSTIRPRIR